MKKRPVIDAPPLDMDDLSQAVLVWQCEALRTSPEETFPLDSPDFRFTPYSEDSDTQEDSKASLDGASPSDASPDDASQ